MRYFLSVLSLFLAVSCPALVQAGGTYNNPSGTTVNTDVNFSNFPVLTTDHDLITNSGTINGSINGNANPSGSGGSNQITNSAGATVNGTIYGRINSDPNSSGGSNTINNSGTANWHIIGSDNSGSSSSGGSNTIKNSGTVNPNISGSLNSGTDSSGGSNTINNSGTVNNYIIGSYNYGTNSNGGSNAINNAGIVKAIISGSWNSGTDSSGGSNMINNSGTVNWHIIGSDNSGSSSSGGSNTINNAGTVNSYIIGSNNRWDNSNGGYNTITNSGIVSYNIYGSYSDGTNSSGGSNTITNTGTVNGYIFGSYNKGANSSGGSNTITNSGTVTTIIDGNRNSGTNSIGGSNTITNSGTVTMYIDGSENIGQYSSGGSNTIINSGNTGTIEGSWNYGKYSSGGYNTIINSGIITTGGYIGGSENLGDYSSGGSNRLTNSGTVNGDIIGSYNYGTNSSGGSNTITNSGTVNGNIYGSRDIGAGSVSSGNTITNAGFVTGSIYGGGGNDTIILVGGSSLGGVADGGSGNNTLGFNNMGTLDGSLLGTKYLNFQNLGIYGGTNTLTGIWDFSGGTTTIYQGNLYVNGSLLTSQLTVGRDGLLGGDGSIYGNVGVYGTVSPGNSIGTLAVNGSVSFLPGSIYLAQLAANGSSDLLRVSGPVSIDNAQLVTSLEKALYPNGRSWRIIDASGGINGSFSSISTDFTSSIINLKQATQGGSLDLVIDRTPYASFGNTKNQAAVGAGLEALLASARGDMANLLLNMDFAMNPIQLSATLKELNPDMYTAFPASGLEIARTFSRMVALRQQKVEPDPGVPTGNQGHLWNVWGQALGNWLNRDKESGVSGYALKTGGAVLGLDRSFGSLVRAGVEMGYNNSSLSLDDPGNSGQIDGKHIGVYGQARHGNLYLDAMTGYTSLSNIANRQISTPLFTAQAASSFESSIWDTTLSGGYDFALGRLRLGPIISFNYQRLAQNSFNEGGAGDFVLRIQDSTVESLTSSLGLQASGVFPIGRWRFLPRATLSLAHQFKDDPVNLTANFVNYTEGAFQVSSAKPAANEVQASLGLSVDYNKNLSFYLDFCTLLADNRNSNILTVGLNWIF